MSIVVDAPSGRFRGFDDRGVRAFLGIRYAEAPSGARRYRPPQRVPRHHDVFVADAYGPICLQKPMPGVFGEYGTPDHPQGDDCLRLNVWTPDPAAAGLPVLLWIHGGAFYAGSGIDPVYNGSMFARNEVVCVTINYRLGAQGYWNLAGHFPELAESGNLGLLDQIAALGWVRDNIASFGGDPRNITIAGESAGGMSVGALLAAPKAQGLFNRAIAQSGAAHNALSAETASKVAGHLLDKLGVRPGDLGALLSVPPEQVLEAQTEIIQEPVFTRDPDRFGQAVTSPMPFQPTYGTEVLPQLPIDAVRLGSAAGVDLLVGTTLEEALIFVAGLKDFVNEQIVELLLDAMMRRHGLSGAEVLAVYRSHRPGAASHELASAIVTDLVFRAPAVRLAEAQAQHTPNTWMYRFDWRSPARGGEFGACHFLEVPFVFDQLDNEQIRGLVGDPPQELADLVHGAWVAFARTGDPNHRGLTGWPRYEAARRATMCLDVIPSVVDDPAPEELAVWDGIV